MYCPHCGAENADNATVCYRCGQPLHPTEYTPAPRLYTQSVIALILSILGIFCGYSALVGLLLGVSALVQINRSRGIYRGKNYAIAAIVIGGIFVIAYAIYAALIFSGGAPRP